MAKACCSCAASLRTPPSLLNQPSKRSTYKFSGPRPLISIQSSVQWRLANRQQIAWHAHSATRRPISRAWREGASGRRRDRGAAIVSHCTRSPVIAALSLRNNIPSSLLAGVPLLLSACIPLAVTLFISVRLHLELEREICVAVLRASAQLATLGFALKVVFEGQNAMAWSISAMIVMVVVAGQTAGERAKTFPHSRIVTTAAIVGGAFGTIWLMVLLKVLPLETRYLIPAAAYLSGNSMTVVSVTLNYIENDVRLHEQQIEAALALGATPHQAMAGYVKKAIVLAMSPIFDHMKVSGLVTLPGAVTGMLISGSHPLEAVRQSLLLIYMLVGAASLTAVVGAQIGWRLLFSNTMQLLKTS